MTNRPPNQPRWMITLIAIWLILQCFDYTLLDPIFTVNLGVSVTPDRFVFLLVLGSYVIASASFSTRAKRITGLELLMILFSVYCLVSWFISGADFVLTKSRWLSTLFTLCFQPFAAYFIASRLPYDRSHIRTLISVLAAIGVYLGLTGIFEHYSISPLVFPKYILDPSVGIQFERARGPFAS
ncbi:MAG TPA: hypothetical protein VFY29_11305, partial [Terriglobia bacterium]|nr:hypothetical protein [Terriglobia bacterium]